MSCADVSRPGALRPGSKLPTEVELMGEFDVSRVVARLAVGVLRTEGLIYSRLRMMRFKGWVRSNLACRLSLDNVPRWLSAGGGVVTVGNAPAASPLPGECGRRRQGGSPPSEGEHFSVNADEPSRRLTACATLVHLNCCFVPSCLAR